MSTPLSDAQLQQFRDEGWLIVDDVFDVERDFGPILADYERIADEIASDLLAAGKITHYDPQASYADKMISLAKQSGDVPFLLRCALLRPNQRR